GGAARHEIDNGMGCHPNGREAHSASPELVDPLDAESERLVVEGEGPVDVVHVQCDVIERHELHNASPGSWKKRLFAHWHNSPPRIKNEGLAMEKPSLYSPSVD